jgi:hypothetical protein|nr:MAG TPA: hypothetical protein [Caudoviricetes sp.]
MYSKKSIPLHCQNKTRILIKNKTNMKPLELKDLKAGNYYKEKADRYTIYIEVLSEGTQGLCNYLYLTKEEEGSVQFSIKKKYLIRGVDISFEKYTKCTKKEFNQTLQLIKDSLTF